GGGWSGGVAGGVTGGVGPGVSSATLVGAGPKVTPTGGGACGIGGLVSAGSSAPVIVRPVALTLRPSDGSRGLSSERLGSRGDGAALSGLTEAAITRVSSLRPRRSYNTQAPNALAEPTRTRPTSAASTRSPRR